jgi:hypothetical protein
LFDEQGIPCELRDYLGQVDVLITLAYQDGYVGLRLVKDRSYPPPGDLDIRLDPRSLLISK